MSRIKARNTNPELVVRRGLHALGYRFKTHVRDLPGKPDLVFSRRKKVVLVHGCFWHQHSIEACLDGRPPKTNTEYWNQKLRRNVERDEANREKLKAAGWDVLEVWECETERDKSTLSRVTDFLGPPRHS